MLRRRRRLLRRQTDRGHEARALFFTAGSIADGSGPGGNPAGRPRLIWICVPSLRLREPRLHARPPGRTLAQRMNERDGTRTRQTWTARQPPRISRSLGRLIRPDKADRARAHITALFSLTDMAHLQKQLKGDVWPLLHATPAKRGRPPHQQPFRAAQSKSHRAWRQERASSSLLPPPPWPLSAQSSAREAQRLSAHY